MVRALLLALACAAAASAAHYVDYSGVKMPAYGSASDYEAPRDVVAAQPSDDYRGHSPDAPASPDYKYEEEPHIKTEKPSKDSDDSEVWRKPGRKQRGLMRPFDSASAVVANKYERDEEDVPKFRLSHRYPKHRSRLKSDDPTRHEESPPRRPVKYSRDRKDDVSDIDRKDYFHVDKDDFRDDKSKEFDEDVKFVIEPTTRRVIRRKPRDRQNKRKSNDLDFGYEEEMDLDRRLKGDSDNEGLRRTRPTGARPVESRAHDRFRPSLDDEEDDSAKVQPHAKMKPKIDEDYDDYYDMKRVYSIKSKLPSLLRRTTERVHPPTSTGFLDMLWATDRRMMPPEPIPDFEKPAAIVSRPSSNTTPRPTSTITTTSPTTTPTTTPVVITTIESTMKVNAPALSLAEKSRLSIMKKDQRKEGQHIKLSTKKPPVLLQVTKYLPTVVMVEPPSSIAPWMRVRELTDDSPEQVEKAKKLMRHKLVADAKSIHDLTDNWDDMVCDYIDVSLLDSGAGALRLPSSACRCTLLALVCGLFMFG